MAFVEFYNVEDAKRVKAFVNSSDLWKGTIQFAKKNIYNMNETMYIN